MTVEQKIETLQKEHNVKIEITSGERMYIKVTAFSEKLQEDISEIVILPINTPKHIRLHWLDLLTDCLNKSKDNYYAED